MLVDRHGFALSLAAAKRIWALEDAWKEKWAASLCVEFRAVARTVLATVTLPRRWKIRCLFSDDNLMASAWSRCRISHVKSWSVKGNRKPSILSPVENCKARQVKLLRFLGLWTVWLMVVECNSMNLKVSRAPREVREKSNKSMCIFKIIWIEESKCKIAS